MARLVSHRNRRDPFVRLEREVMEDPTMSFKAKALYAWLLDKGEYPGGWEIDVERIEAISTDRAFAIRAALVELETAGRLVRSDSGKGGRGKRARWDVYDEPKPMGNREVLPEHQTRKPRAIDAETAMPHLVIEKTSFSKTRNASPSAPRARVEPSRFHPMAKAIVLAVYRDRSPKPTVRGGQVAMTARAVDLLDAGWTSAQVRSALMEAKSFTLDSLTLQLNKATSGTAHQSRTGRGREQLRAAFADEAAQ